LGRVRHPVTEVGFAAILKDNPISLGTSAATPLLHGGNLRQCFGLSLPDPDCAELEHESVIAEFANDKPQEPELHGNGPGHKNEKAEAESGRGDIPLQGGLGQDPQIQKSHTREQNAHESAGEGVGALLPF